MKPTTYLEMLLRAEDTCEACQKPSRDLEVHHLIERSKTPKGRIRDLTEVPELLAAICPKCHAEAHSYPDTVRDRLFQNLYQICSYEAVQAAFDAVAATPIYLGYELPEAE